jgi:hypothetical protein
VDWIGLAQDRDKWRAVMNLRVPYNTEKLSSGYKIGGLTSSSQFQRVNFSSLSYFIMENLTDSHRYLPSKKYFNHQPQKLSSACVLPSIDRNSYFILNSSINKVCQHYIYIMLHHY